MNNSRMDNIISVAFIFLLIICLGMVGVSIARILSIHSNDRYYPQYHGPSYESEMDYNEKN